MTFPHSKLDQSPQSVPRLVRAFVRFSPILLAILATSAAQAQRVSLSDLVDDLRNKPELRFVQLTDEVLDGAAAGFQATLLCSQSFTLKSFLVTGRDASQTVSLSFNSVIMVSSPFDPSLTPPWSWDLASGSFSLNASGGSSGAELMSQLQVSPVAIPSGSSIAFFGSRSPNTGVTRLFLGATVETSSDPANTCRITVADF